MSDDRDTLTETNSSPRKMSNQAQNGFDVHTEHVITPDGVVTTVSNLLASGFDVATVPSSVQPNSAEAVAAALVGQSSFAVRVMMRYRDAYLVANMTTAIGNTLKSVGVVLAGVICIGGILVANQMHIDIQTMFVVPSLILAILTGTTFYLKASLDCAVNGSPFLTDEQRAKTMTL